MTLPVYSSREEFMNEALAHRVSLERIAAVKLGDSDEAQDAVNDALLKACEKRDQLRDREKLAAWLTRIVINHCNDLLRSRRDAPLGSYDTPVQENSVAERSASIDTLEQVIDLFLGIEPEEFRDVLILYYYRGMTYQDMASELGVPLGTVQSRLTRGRKKLRELLEAHGITSYDLEEAGSLDRWPGILLT